MDLYEVRNELNKGRSIYDLPLRVVFYARVSTEKDEQAHSLKNQIEYYSNFIKNNDNWTYIDGYIDEGLSGTSVNKRENFLRMINDAKLKKFDFVITKEISRFSRNTMDSIKYTQELLNYGVGVLFQSDNINTLMPDSELRLTIMSSIAQDEVRKISERVKFGFKRAVEKGVVLGNSRIWGYDKEDGKLLINEEEANIIRKIFDLYAIQNLGMRMISNYLASQGIYNKNGNQFSFSTIKSILTNPKYKGYYCGNKSVKYDYKMNNRKMFNKNEWVMYKDEENVPSIINEEIWNKANNILIKRNEKMTIDDKTSYQNKYTYSGKIICMEHNVAYHRVLFQYKSGDKEAWQCKIYNQKGKRGCTSPTLYTSDLNSIMKMLFGNLIEEKNLIKNKLLKIYLDLSEKSSNKDEIKKTNKEINELKLKKDKLLDLSVKGKIDDDEFEKRNNHFNENLQILNNKILDLEKEDIKNTDIKNSIDVLNDLISKELEFDDIFNNTIIDSLIEKIEVYKTEDINRIELIIHLKTLNNVHKYSINKKSKLIEQIPFHTITYI